MKGAIIHIIVEIEGMEGILEMKVVKKVEVLVGNYRRKMNK